jgi:hypothetical protein
MFEGGDEVAFWARKISISQKKQGAGCGLLGDERTNLVKGVGVPLVW